MAYSGCLICFWNIYLETAMPRGLGKIETLYSFLGDPGWLDSYEVLCKNTGQAVQKLLLRVLVSRGTQLTSITVQSGFNDSQHCVPWEIWEQTPDLGGQN